MIPVIGPSAPLGSALEHRGSGLDLAMVGNNSLLGPGLAPGAGRFSATLAKNGDISHFLTPPFLF